MTRPRCGTFRERSLAVHKCKARLESRVPSSFGDWLSKQTPDLCLALFSIFPVHSGQVQLLSQIADFVGADQIAALGMEHFVIGLTYPNRWLNITQARRRA